MTEQQQHLQSAIQQQQTLNEQLNQVNSQSVTIRDSIVKLQGVIEYLTQLGVTLPQQSSEEETPVSETEVVED